ncbi:MAG TPA: molecular chaperone HtpG [Bacteroidales bacterium]|jgi:molecular chaperone HtpG|nr:molecular chaperone HtpG [Bacteroidales bacterium]OQC57817.1 MAG: Chaperone protein HtpG [Bacteroidetes bacterium ADurb.Bin013]NLZ09539.1 molecular chaperone HtpG [Bacteroidales bacterium]HNR27110.1 molecular chaperone HtpG [Bacteroidales bacterium]HNT47419.1 molecular chaperone HtpG [Bacteroidales bacterium]
MKNKGTIGVTTGDIFPVIKKFLYSDHEIFLRELISNAVDATQKLKALAAKGDFKGEMGDLTIRVSSDKDKSMITVSDRGIGMTEEEVEKYINQIAFSSAGEFLEKYKDQENNIIGHFGLGFYSSFMVAKKVEIVTKSWKEGAQAVRWTCKGTPEYTMEPADKQDRGTDIILHLYAEYQSYAQESKINELLNKYCSFLPVEIAFGKEKEWKDGKEVVLDKDRIINDVTPLWTRKPVDLKDEDYKAFYEKLYPLAEEPLFWIHLNVDYPFKLTGVLYFPRIKDKLEVTRNKIRLYCNQVFVTDNVESIVPDFLTLLHGVIDSPDIPLNVSRSYLQSDSNVKKISAHITRKVADRLEEIFKNDRPSLEEKWDNLKLFIEYGMLTEEKFYDRALKFALLKNTDGKYLSFEEYATLIESNQKDKDKKLVYLYATNTEEQFAYIGVAKDKGYDVLLLDSPLCAHFVNLLESKMKDVRFVRIDSDTPEKLIPKEDIAKPDISEDEEKALRELFQEVLPKEATFTVAFENMGSQQLPVVITRGEWMRRYREMSALGGGMNFMGTMPESYNLVVNFEHPLVQRIRETKDRNLVSQICDLALLANNLLKGEALSTFIKRSVDIIQ